MKRQLSIFINDFVVEPAATMEQEKTTRNQMPVINAVDDDRNVNENDQVDGDDINLSYVLTELRSDRIREKRRDERSCRRQQQQ